MSILKASITSNPHLFQSNRTIVGITAHDAGGRGGLRIPPPLPIGFEFPGTAVYNSRLDCLEGYPEFAPAPMC
jgi:hypothetical protein